MGSHNMRAAQLLLGLGLLLPASTSPSGETVEVDLEKDFKAFKQEMRKEMFLSKSPCGAVIDHLHLCCTCEDGSTDTLDFTPGTKPCDGALDFCSCPNGETFDKQQIKEIVKSLKAERGKN